MSIFDPHQLYSHNQKYSHKGQIIQKKPRKRISAISADMIPYSINVLKTYGYTIYKNPPHNTRYSIPFNINITSFSQHWKFDLMTNFIFSYILNNEDSLIQFINQYNNLNYHANMLIGISSMFFTYTTERTYGADYSFSCQTYNNGNSDELIHIGQPLARVTGGLLIGAPGPDNFIYQFDRNISSREPHDAYTYTVERANPISYKNVINYAFSDAENLWSSIVRSGVLPDSFSYLLEKVGFVHETTDSNLLFSRFCGFLSIELW